jgi:biotin carboxyl carrier protein
VADTIQTETRQAADPPSDGRSVERAAIAESIDELLPALIAKLGATGLAELEVRQNGLRVRLRRPPEGSGQKDRRASDRGERTARGAAGSGSGSHASGLAPVGPGREREGRDARDFRDPNQREDGRTVAMSPAVGIFQPRSGARAGTRVRAGDRIGTVDMLGVPQDVVAPTDGVVGASLVEPGDAVEYGQGLVVIEFASPSVPPGGSSRATAVADR